MNFSIFQSIATQVEQPMLDSVNGISDALLSAISGPLHAALVIYIAMLGGAIAFGKMTEPLRDTWGRIGKAAVLAGFLTAGTYNTYIRDFFLNGLPNDLAGAIAGKAGAISAAAFDRVWNRAFDGGLVVWKTLSWTDVGLQFLVVAYWVMAALASAFAFLVWMVSHVVLGLYVAVGPIFLATYLFAATRSLGERWVASMLTMIVLQVFVVSLLVVLTGAENALLSNIAAAGGNSVAQIQAMFAPIILFLVALGVVVQLPGAAAAIAGGFHYHAHGMMRATVGTATRMGSGALSGIRVTSGAISAATTRRLMPPTPGRSMSGAGA